MALGTNLEADIRTALANSASASDSADLLATAINNYLSGAEYGEGAVLWSGSVVGPTFELAASGTAAGAASQWGNGVMSYWGAAGNAVGTAGEPTQLDSVVPPILIAGSVVGPALTASLTTIFSSVSNSDTLDGKAGDIAGAIESAITPIVVTWSEFSAGPPPVTLPLTGGIA